MAFYQTPLITGETYHVFNRGIDRRVTFSDKREYARAFQTLSFYTAADIPLKLSHYLAQNLEVQAKIVAQLQVQPQFVSVLAYCLMPNHFHLLIRQETEYGISNYLSLLQNSYTRYFNTKHQRTGALFQGTFKAVHIESHGQILHTSRYIHLNPFTAHLVQDEAALINYPWSSLNTYASPPPHNFIETRTILESFKSPRQYLEFVLDQANYQRSFHTIKHVAIE